MAGRSDNNKQVPDKMPIAQAWRGEKRKTTRVSYATCQYPKDAG